MWRNFTTLWNQNNLPLTLHSHGTWAAVSWVKFLCVWPSIVPRPPRYADSLYYFFFRGRHLTRNINMFFFSLCLREWPIVPAHPQSLQKCWLTESGHKGIKQFLWESPYALYDSTVGKAWTSRLTGNTPQCLWVCECGHCECAQSHVITNRSQLICYRAMIRLSLLFCSLLGSRFEAHVPWESWLEAWCSD